MRALVQEWGIVMVGALALTVGLYQMGVNVGGALHGFVGQIIHLFGTSILH